jgi:hypothetical protein
MFGAKIARPLIRTIGGLVGDSRRYVAFGGAAIAALALGIGATVALGDSSATVTYTATQTVPVPPASNYHGEGGGDGWAVALSDTQVFNVFHHNGSLQVACHNQADASDCWPDDPTVIEDASQHGFTTSGQPGMFLDPNTNKLYVYATRGSDGTGGVVCVDVSNPTVDPSFCGFTALTAVGEAYNSSFSALGTPMNTGGKLYSFNYFPGAGAAAGTSGTENTLLCFDESTDAACSGQPYSLGAGLGLGAGTMETNLPSPVTATIGGELIIPLRSSTNGDQIACWNSTTQADCGGSFPVTTGFSFAGGVGGPFPMVDAAGDPTGFCLPTSSAPCYDLTGMSVTSPPNLATTINNTGGSASWDGPGVTIGPRVYIPEWDTGVDCFDYSTDSACPHFPKQFSGLDLLYTVNTDPQRPTCLWINSDDGVDQIQSFDAFTGDACGQGAIRVLASQFVIPQKACNPSSYDSLQVTQPAPGTYTSGSISFEDIDGNPIPGASDVALDASGTAKLTGLNLNAASGSLPQFLITLNGLSGSLGQVAVKLTWEDTYNAACTSTGVTATPPPTSSTGTVTVTVTTTTTTPVPVTLTKTVTTTTKVKVASAPKKPTCPTAAGGLGGTAVGVFSIGMSRRQARDTLTRYRVTENKFDNFCLHQGWGIRLGYPSAGLLKTLSKSLQNEYKGHVVLALTANPVYHLDGATHRDKIAGVARRLHLGKPFHVGSNDWYFAPGAYAYGIFKVRHGVIQEVGLASIGLNQTRAQQSAFINSFDKL